MALCGSESQGEKRAREQQERQFQQEFGEDVRRFDLSREQDISRYQKRLSTGQATGEAGERQLLSATGQAPPELAALQSQILAGATPAQGMQDRRTSLALRESGVRGPEAGLERSRQSGINTREMQRMFSQYALQDAQRRQGQRSGYFGQKALAGQQAAY